MMKRFSILFLLFISTLHLLAQPKDAWKATVTLQAYDTNGENLYTGTAFFVDPSGTIVAQYAPFTKATRAEIIDQKGKHFDVTHILGASEKYGLIRLRTTARSNAYLTPITDSNEVAQKGDRLYAVGYLRTKKETPQVVTIQEAERYDEGMFYTTNLGNESKYTSCPLINSAGKVVAIVSNQPGEALDVRFATTMVITANSALNKELRALPMPKALPEGQEEAKKYITLLEAVDPAAALIAMNDYISVYPKDAEGYLSRASRYAALKQYTLADQDFQTALQNADATTADAIHYNYSRTLYTAYVNDTTAAIHHWDLERALQEANTAYSLSPLPLYALQQGNCLYAMERYHDAYEKYTLVNASDIASDDTYFTAMLALERAGWDTAEILKLLDKTIELQSRPYNTRAATYFFERAQRLVAYGQYRKAVLDYNKFESIIGPRDLNDTFYYMREQAELQGHMYQQALDDIQSAILTASSQRKPYYQYEEAFIYFTCAEYEKALASGLEAYSSLPNHIPLIRILAVSYGETGNKAKALELLRHAKELGDEAADALIEKYQ